MPPESNFECEKLGILLGKTGHYKSWGVTRLFLRAAKVREKLSAAFSPETSTAWPRTSPPMDWIAS